MDTYRQRFSALILAAGLLAGAAAAVEPDAAAPAAEASAVVARLQRGLIDLARESAAAAAPKVALEQLVGETHDLPYIARIVLGRQWRVLGSAEQTAFIDAFTALSVASYASRFSGYSGQRFEVSTEQALPPAGRQVTSVLETAAGKEIEFEFLLHESNGRWQIVNILVDGVSDLALKRAEYARLLREGGFGGLIAELERQTAALRAGERAPT